MMPISITCANENIITQLPQVLKTSFVFKTVLSLRISLLATTVELPNKRHVGTSLFVLSLKLKMNYCYRKGRCPEECPLLGGCPFLRGSTVSSSKQALDVNILTQDCVHVLAMHLLMLPEGNAETH